MKFVWNDSWSFTKDAALVSEDHAALNRVFDTYTPFTNPVGIEMPIFFCQILISLFHVTLRCGII